MHELQKYRQNISAMLEQMGGGKPYHLVEFDKVPKPSKEGKPLSMKPKDEKQQSSNGDSNGAMSEFDFPDSNDGLQESLSSNQISVSNHIPCPPQLVVVSSHDDGGNMAALFQGNDSISEPSSPGSEPELQIDLGPSERRGGGGGDKSIRVAPSASRSLLGTIKRTVATPIGLDFAPEVTRTTTPTGGFLASTSSSSSSPYLHTPTRFKRTKGRPGEALSDIATSLAVRRVAQLGCGQPVLIPSTPNQNISLTAPPLSAGGPTSPSLNPTPNSPPIVSSAGLVQDEPGVSPRPPPAPPTVPSGDGEQGQTSLSSQFSSIYPKEKTAIAVVDLDQKRVRKRKGNDPENPPPPSKKVVRTPKGKVQPHNPSSASYLTPPIITMVTAVPSVIVATSESTPPQPQPHPPPQAAATTLLPLPAVEVAQAGGRGTSPTAPRGLGAPPKGAKRMKGMKLHVPKQPVNPAGIPSSATAAVATSSMLAPPPAPPLAEKAAPPAGVQQGEEGEGQEEMMVEGNGLLADTIRQVDRTFKARMDLLTGQPGDLGFKYFTEKVFRKLCVLCEVSCVFPETCACVHMCTCMCVCLYLVLCINPLSSQSPSS